MPKEAVLERKIQVYLEGRGAYAKKYHAGMYSGSGKSDRIVCYRGRFLSIEIKRADRVDKHGDIAGVTLEQSAHLRKVIAAGGIGIAVNSLQEVIDTLDAIDREFDHERVP
jgi:penicillin-binding protein-related factor A (putative recombinase)